MTTGEMRHCGCWLGVSVDQYRDPSREQAAGTIRKVRNLLIRWAFSLTIGALNGFLEVVIRSVVFARLG